MSAPEDGGGSGGTPADGADPPRERGDESTERTIPDAPAPAAAAEAAAAPVDAPAKAEDPWFNEGCTLFDQPNYAGNRFQLGGDAGLQFRKLPDGWDRRFKSMHCEPGCSVLVFTEPDFYGQSWSFDRSYPNVAKGVDGWDDWHAMGSAEIGCAAATP